MSDQKATSIGKVIQQFGQKLGNFVRSRVRSIEDAEDIVQEVWFQFSSLSDIGDIDNVGAWLYRVAGNKIIDRSRKNKPVSFDDLAEPADDEDENYLKEILLMDTSGHPERAFFKELFWSEFDKALNEMPENQREVFILNEMEGITLQEIANRQGENLKTIISRKGYAVKQLKNKLHYLYNELNN